MFTLLIVLVILGFLAIVLEDLIHIDKAKTTLFFGSLVWVLYFVASAGFDDHGHLQLALNENLLDIATLWLFLVAAMTFVVYLSSRGIIEGLVNRVLPDRLSEARLMLLTGISAFLFSSLADNITSTLVCLTVLLSLDLPREKLLRYIVLVVFAVNSGGVALITGDVTTLMIFLAGKIDIADVMLLSVPAGCAVLLLAWLLSRGLTGELVLHKREVAITRGDMAIAGLFVMTVLGTILANIFYQIPPVLSFLFGLSVMFLTVELFNKDDPVLDYVRKIEFDTLLFFLGVLLLVGMLKELQVLDYFPQLYELMPTLVANYTVGLLSALFDNVPLTAALLKSGIDMELTEWLALTYSVGVGGSLLIIGSAAGVVAMSKVDALTFVTYLRFFFYLLVAYSAGFAGVLLLGWLLQLLA